MLQDYKPQFDTPKRLRRSSLVYIQATFASGVATVDTANSAPRVTLTKDTTGDYDLTFPKGLMIVPLGAPTLDPGSDTPTANAVKDVYVRSLNASAGTGKLLFLNSDDGGPEDPGDDTRLYFAFVIGN